MELLPAAALAALALLVGLAAGFALARRNGVGVGGALRESQSQSTASASVPAENEIVDFADWIGVGLLRVNRERTITSANQVAHTLLARSPGALIGRSVMEAFVDHRIADLVREAVSRGAAQRELVFAGEPQPALLVLARRGARDESLWISLQDISELRRLRRIRAEFVDNLSHELRTPLTTVRLLTESLTMELDTMELPPRVRDSIVKIEVETGHLVQMVNELLDLARIEQGEAALRVDDVDLGGVVESTLARLRLYGERQGISLRADVPESAADRAARGDEERLRQVLVNLVHNAVKFSDEGGEVVVRVRPEGDEVRVEVEDSGIGIPRADLNRIFERFYKVDRARHRGSGGTGLGLAIARHIVERHGGRIWAESRDGKGSRFVVALPRRGAAPPAQPG
jgi:two-component system phosphate regulon sensor histidine kinase PhoR